MLKLGLDALGHDRRRVKGLLGEIIQFIFFALQWNEQLQVFGLRFFFAFLLLPAFVLLGLDGCFAWVLGDLWRVYAE